MAQTTTALPGDEPKKPTIADLGPRLPLGVEDGNGKIYKDIAVRRWRMKEERELGELRDSNKDATVFQYVSMVLATMLTKCGQYDFDDEALKFEQKRLIIGQMIMGDVFYAYVWLRIKSLGPDLGLKVRCSKCTKPIEGFNADLNSVDVVTAESMEDACWEYNLRDPFQARGQQIQQLVIGPPRWNSLEMLEGIGGIGKAKPAVIRASVFGLGSKETADQIVATDAELDEMSKMDIELLTNEINDRTVGPNMVVEGKCPYCQFTFNLPIDWGYDSFFAVSSQ